VIQTIDRIGPDPARTGLIGGSLAPDPSPPRQPDSEASLTTESFRSALTTAADERSLSISEHAFKRLEQRQIPLADEQLDRLSKAMDTLSQRGSRQSLVMLDQYAYVVNAPSRTVVTAVDPEQSKERVFTQIDSVVIA
jgi:flagellar operon protein